MKSHKLAIIFGAGLLVAIGFVGWSYYLYLDVLDQIEQCGSLPETDMQGRLKCFEDIADAFPEMLEAQFRLGLEYIRTEDEASARQQYVIVRNIDHGYALLLIDEILRNRPEWITEYYDKELRRIVKIVDTGKESLLDEQINIRNEAEYLLVPEDDEKRKYITRHYRSHMLLVNGAYLESISEKYRVLIAEVSKPEFLEKKASESDNPLAPCALLANSILSTQVFYLQWRIVNEQQFPAPMEGSNIFGMYDKVISDDKFFDQLPEIKADMLARMHIYWSGGFDTIQNTFINELTQSECLVHLLVTDPESLAELLDEPSSGAPESHPSMHYAPVAMHGSTYSNQELEQYLDDLKSSEFLTLTAEATDSPVMPCSLLRAYLSGASIYNLWESVREGKLLAPYTDMPFLDGLRELLKDGSIPEQFPAVAANITATYFAIRILHDDEQVSKSISRLTQRECLDQFTHPGETYRHDVVDDVLWYLESADQGFANAQFRVGTMYEYGQGVEQNMEKALHWYRKAAEQGNANAQINLGLIYARGQGIKQDYAEAVYWYREAAEQGYANAQTNLGYMYEHGRGVTQDDEQAAQWYRQAADQGYAIAQTYLGLMYGEGRGVNKDYSSAADWYRKAAEQDYAEAQFYLALMYTVGHGVKQDKDIARKWYRKACDGGYTEACSYL
jgi:hypothetical protein